MNQSVMGEPGVEGVLEFRDGPVILALASQLRRLELTSPEPIIKTQWVPVSPTLRDRRQIWEFFQKLESSCSGLYAEILDHLETVSKQKVGDMKIDTSKLSSNLYM